MSTRGGKHALQPIESIERAESEAHLHAVAPLAGRGLRLLGTIGFITVVLALFGLAAINALIVENQTMIDSLSSDVTEAQVANERLHLELAELEAPQRIVAEATDRLGMVVPEDIVYLTPPNSVLAPSVVDAAIRPGAPADAPADSAPDLSDGSTDGAIAAAATGADS